MLLEFYALSENELSNYEPKLSIGKAKIPRLPALILGLGVCLSGFSEFSNLIPSDLILFASILVPMTYYVLKQEITASLIKISIFIFGIAYISWSFGLHMLLLRQLKNGANLVLFLLAIVWLGDTGAYFLGNLLGKHKLIEAISSKKTVEGAIGGLCCSVAGGLIVQQMWLKEVVDLKNALILSIILALLAQISDLCESILKRSAKVKDSGTIIPGHGGILDRCDSMIFATPVMYYYCVLRIYS
jgi:phosphatidate cytidylyltransferase